MTGPEKETLAQALELQRAVLASLDAFRLEIGTNLRDFRDEIRKIVDGVDNRLAEVEHAEVSRLAEAAGVARVTARRELARDKREISTGRWLAYLASVATIAGVIVGVIVKFV